MITISRVSDLNFKRQAQMSDYYYIPDELLTKILAFLPAKSLVRFTLVCKSWQSLITSSDFIDDHLNQTKLSNDIDGKHLLFLRYYPGEPEKDRHSLRIDNESSFDEYDVSEFPFKSSINQFCRVLGSCNGLICLSDDWPYRTKTVVLWNPSVRKYLILPVPERLGDHHAIGFGFDSLTNDYKVVRMVYFNSGRDRSLSVQLYKLSSGYWETITSTLDPSYYVDYMSGSQPFLNSTVHWSAFKSGTGKVIMSFNVSEEVFREIRLPDTGHYYMPMLICGEWLSYLQRVNNNYSSIWVMKEYGVVESWTKLYTLDHLNGLGKLLGFRRNGELLLAMTNRDHLVSYDPETRQIKNLGVCDSDKRSRPRHNNTFSFHVEAYVESLVLLGMQADSGSTFDQSEAGKEEHACDESKKEKENQIR